MRQCNAFGFKIEEQENEEPEEEEEENEEEKQVFYKVENNVGEMNIEQLQEEQKIIDEYEETINFKFEDEPDYGNQAFNCTSYEDRLRQISNSKFKSEYPE